MIVLGSGSRFSALEDRTMTGLASAARALVCAVALAASAVATHAQTYPSKPIHLILPYVPGGIIDTAGRNLAVRLTESLGQSVVAENRPGAGGVVGSDVVARSAPDGYTILLTDPGLVSNPTLQPDTPYDLFKQLQAVSIVGSSPAVIVSSLKLPVKTFAELLAYAKANPGKLNFASAGIGTAPHLAGELIKLRAGIDMTHVPYRGIGAAYPDVMNGKVQLAFSSIAGAVPFTSDKRVRALATTRLARSAVYPDVPTVAESGLPGFDIDLWIGIYAPAGMPPAVLARLNSEINKVLQHPELKAAFAKIGIEPRGTTPEEGAAFTRSEFEKWKKVIVEGRIKPE
jgi:tripartite-type tricarboxylate transporter receptor subunit TctC